MEASEAMMSIECREAEMTMYFEGKNLHVRLTTLIKQRNSSRQS